MKLLVSVLAVSLVIGGCDSKPNKKELKEKKTQIELAKECISDTASVSALKNLSSDLISVNKAIIDSSELGECLVNKLNLDNPGSDTEKAQRVLDFVKENINYKVDLSGTRLPVKSLVDEVGDCEDMTALSGTLLKALDIDFYLIHKKPTSGGELGHVYAGIKTDENTGLDCEKVNLKVIDASNKSATVGVRASNAPTFEITCRLGGE